MIARWENDANDDAWWMHTHFRVFGPWPPCRVYLVIPERASLPSFGGEKTLCGTCGTMHRGHYDSTRRRVRDLSCGELRICLDLEVRRVQCRSCHAVKRERLEFLVERTRHTRRFARYVGRRCVSSTIKDVAEELLLGWDAVKELDKVYMREQLERASRPSPKIVGIDEISVRKGHDYRIVVSDLEKQRPIWFGGQDRKETSMDEFYAFLGEKKVKKIRLAVMDMWPAFYSSTRRHAPQAAILYDKFHVIRHLGDALDEVRKREYARLSGPDLKFVKGQKYTLLSHMWNLRGTARRNLRLLLSANKRLNTAYVLKESFGQLWDYRSEASTTGVRS